VGVGAFVAVLMFGPDPEPPRAAARPGGSGFSGGGVAPGFQTDQTVQTQARAFTAQGLDFSAIALLNDYLETSPDFAWGWMFAAQLCLRADESDTDRTELSQALLLKARSNLARLDRENREDEPNRLPPTGDGSRYTHWFVAGWAAWGAGDEARARETFLAGLAQNEQQTAPDSTGRLYDGACLLALAGQTDDAIARIERLADVGYNNPRWLGRDPDLQALHRDPRFFDAVERIEAALAEARLRVQQAQRATEPANSDPQSSETGP
jgi:hypothetical protein